MKAHVESILRISATLVIAVVLIVVARQIFAWTNPGGSPPFSNSAISTLGGNVGIGTVNPNSKLEVFAPALGSNVNDVVEVQRLNSSNGNNNYLDVRNMRTSAGTDWTTAGMRIQEKIDSTWMGYVQFNGDNNGGITFGTGLTTTFPGNVPERMRITSSGNVGIGVVSPDSNYKITTGGGGIKAETNTAQPAGYFNNTGGGTAITVGTGGITLGGVNQTSWPSSGLGGSGTINYIPKWTSASALGNSLITDDGTTITNAGQYDVAGGSGTAYTTAPIEVRTTASPRVSFHWPGVVASQIGMDSAGTIRTYDNPGTGYANFSAAGITANGTVNATGDFYSYGNYGSGLVGLYDPTKYRNVYAMSPSYRLVTDGTGPGNLYGIAMTYEPNYGGAGNNAQAVTGLGHQFLFMSNGVTQTAIGTGIYTVGNAGIAGTATVGSLVAGGGSSSNWASINGASINALNSIYSYGSICTGNNSGACNAAGGVVLGLANTGAGANITAGTSFFSGNVGIGTTAPASKLSVGGAGVAYTGVYGTGDNYGLYGFTQYGIGVYGQSNYDIGVSGYGATTGVMGRAYDIGFGATGVYGEGIYNPTYLSSGYGVYGKSPNGYGVYCSGLYCGGNKGWTVSSDARLKTNIQTINDGLEKVLKLRGVTFDWKDGNGGDMGFIAQEAKDIIPEVVSTDQEGYYSMRTASITGVLVEAVKEQQKQIEGQRAQLEGQKQEIEDLKKAILH